MSDTKIGTHAEVTLFLREDGTFYGVVDQLTLSDKTLVGLKKRIDNYRRGNTRTRAAALQVAVLVLSSEWVDNDTRRAIATWHHGTFGGVNAHTGAVTIVKANNGRLAIEEQAWFFRADDDEALASIQALIDERLRTDKAATDAKTKLSAALKRCAHRVGDRYSMKGTEKAAQVEDALISALEAKP